MVILIHNDYETDFIDLLRRYNIPTKADFNPSSGSILADPKFTNLTPAERDATASELQRTRIARALDHIRAPVKFAAARFFLEKQWISKSKFDSLKTDQHTQMAAIFGDSSKQPTTQPDITLQNDDTNDIQMDDTQEDSPAKDSLTSGTDAPINIK